MKATGIVRRIDDLGRVVIPKEIRRHLRIREGDALEIFTDNHAGQPCVCFCKYEKENPRHVVNTLYQEACDDGDMEIAAILRRAEQELARVMKERDE